MKVICFYWQGDRWQSDTYKKKKRHVNLQMNHLRRIGTTSNELASRYVNNLYEGVKRFASKEFEFICFTNEELDTIKEVSKRKFPLLTVSGVLPRLYMFSKESGLQGDQVLCLDLDVVIVGNLKPLMSYDGPFCARSKFKRGEEYKLDGDVMSFKASKEMTDFAWKPFVNNIQEVEKRTKGRERYYMREIFGKIADRWDRIAPGSVLSYKRHMTGRGDIPEKASIVSCHGYPRPHQVSNKVIKEFWK